MMTPLLASFPPSLWGGICASGTDNCSITSGAQIVTLLTNIIEIALAFAGALAIIFIILGGIFYVISAGNPSNIKRAKDILVNSITGLIIAGLAYSIVAFIAGRF